MCFPLEVVNAVVDTIGAERTSLHISPWSEFHGEEYPFCCAIPELSPFVSNVVALQAQ